MVAKARIHGSYQRPFEPRLGVAPSRAMRCCLLALLALQADFPRAATMAILIPSPNIKHPAAQNDKRPILSYKRAYIPGTTFFVRGLGGVHFGKGLQG